MLFSSFAFAGLFLPVALIAFWCVPGDRAKRGVLLVASLAYYGYWLPSYLLLLVALVGIAWLCARAAGRTPDAWPVIVAAVALLGTLAYFKYTGFVARILGDLGVAPGVATNLPGPALPLGISFIVFQALGYVVDVHRREFAAEPRFSVVLLFKAFFPQLIAGPICRAHELIPQLRGRFRFDATVFCNGLAIFATGLFLKTVFADGLSPTVDDLFAMTTGRTRHEAWAATIGFGMQIYADFWGYSTMAVGLAKMFGIAIPVNFDLPYSAVSLRDFWRRWHITLSHWLRDYLYKPLGGSRHGMRRTILALFVTMLLGGLWHGANYTFIAWGALHGAILSAEHLARDRSASLLAGVPGWLRRPAGWGFTMAVVFVAWVFFRAPGIPDAITMIRELASGTRASMSTAVRQVFGLAVALFVLQFPFEAGLRRLRADRVDVLQAIPLAFVLLVAAIVLGAPVAAPFIYFQF